MPGARNRKEIWQSAGARMIKAGREHLSGARRTGVPMPTLKMLAAIPFFASSQAQAPGSIQAADRACVVIPANYTFKQKGLNAAKASGTVTA
jgi:hypothetical protein